MKHLPRRVGWESPSWALEAAARGATDGIPRQFLWLVDVCVVCLAFAAAYRLAPTLQALMASAGMLQLPWLESFRPPAVTELGDFRTLGDHLWILLVTLPAILLGMQVLGGYRDLLQQSRTRVILSSALAPVAGLGSLALVIFALKQHRLSRLLVFTFLVFCVAAFLGYRMGIRTYRRRREQAGAYAHNVVVIAPPKALTWLTDYFDAVVPSTSYRMAGYLRQMQSQAPNRADEADDRKAPQIPCLGDEDELEDLLIHRPVHDVVVVQGDASNRSVQKVIEACDYFQVTLHIVPEVLIRGSLSDLKLVYRAGSLQLPEVVLRPPHFDSGALFVKRLIDVVVSGAALLLLSPLFLAIAIAIKLTTPTLTVLYPWRVVGYKGKPFTGYKFTTMVEDADDQKADLEHLNEMTGPVFKIKDDPRVTTLGRFLRKYSLNELPQFWSVLKGDMSLVGPRPAGPNELARYELWHKRKLSVQSGITCLWQVRGRNAISNFDDWVRMDLEYIDNWSLWLDLKILVETVWVVLGGTGS